METAKHHELHKDIMSLLTEVYWHGCSQDNFTSWPLSESFEEDVSGELWDILQEHGLPADVEDSKGVEK